MSGSDAAPLPRLGEVFFDVRGSTRSMRLSWYSDTGVAVFSIWQGGTCTGTFRLPATDLGRLMESLQRGGPEAEPSPARPLALTAGPGASGPEPYTGMIASLPDPGATTGASQRPGTAVAVLPAAAPVAEAPQAPAPEPSPPYPDPYGGDGGMQPFPDARPYTASVVADYAGTPGYNGLSSFNGTSGHGGGSTVDYPGYPGGSYGAAPDYTSYPGYPDQQSAPAPVPAPAGDSTHVLGPDELAYLRQGLGEQAPSEPAPPLQSAQDYFPASMSSSAGEAAPVPGSGGDAGFFSRPDAVYGQPWPTGQPAPYGQPDPYAGLQPAGEQPPGYDGYPGQQQAFGESGYSVPAPDMSPYPAYGPAAGAYSTVSDGYSATADGYGATADGYGATADGYGATADGYGAVGGQRPEANGFGGPPPGFGEEVRTSIYPGAAPDGAAFPGSGFPGNSLQGGNVQPGDPAGVSYAGFADQQPAASGFPGSGGVFPGGGYSGNGYANGSGNGYANGGSYPGASGYASVPEDAAEPGKPAGFPGTDVYPSGNYPVPAANGYPDAGASSYPDAGDGGSVNGSPFANGRGGGGSPFPPAAGNGTGTQPRPGFTPSFSPNGGGTGGGAPNGGGTGRHGRPVRTGQPPQRSAGRPGGTGGYPDARNGGYPGGGRGGAPNGGRGGQGYGRPGYGDAPAPGGRGPRPGGGPGGPSFVPNGQGTGRLDNRVDPREQRYGRGR